jgi:hypothetical protein
VKSTRRLIDLRESGTAATAELAVDVELAGDVIPLAEKSIAKDGTALLKIIQPGWGSSGYYSKAVLERDGPKVFAEGTKNYLDHPTKADEVQRPERSLRDLVSVQAEPARYLEHGPEGEGLYAKSRIFSNYQPLLEEYAPYIGTSIRALGRGKRGEAEGREGTIIEQLVAAKSVDYVTQAGAGGRIVQLFEAADRIATAAATHCSECAAPIDAAGKYVPAKMAATSTTTTAKEADAPHLDLKAETLRQHLKDAHYKDPDLMGDAKESTMQACHSRAHNVSETTQKEIDVDDKTVTELKERVARAELALVLREARDVAVREVARSPLPDAAKERIAETMSANPPMKDGTLDRAALTTAITEAVKREADYLAKATGAGKVHGFGAAPTEDESKLFAASEKRLQESFRRLGLDEKTATIAAAGRN